MTDADICVQVNCPFKFYPGKIKKSHLKSAKDVKRRFDAHPFFLTRRQDSHIFPLFEKIDAPEEKEHQHPRNCFALIGCDKVQFEKGKAVIPVYFRCCPTHHTSKKGENFVRMRVRIVKSPNVVFESDFMQVQWKVEISFEMISDQILERKT